MPRSPANHDPFMMGPDGMYASPEEEFDAQFMLTMGVPAEIRPSLLRKYSTQATASAERRTSRAKEPSKKKRDSSDMVEKARVTQAVTRKVSVDKSTDPTTTSTVERATLETAAPKVKRTKSTNSAGSIKASAPTEAGGPGEPAPPRKPATRLANKTPSDTANIPWTLRKVLRRAQRDHEAAEAAAKQRNEEYKGSASDILKTEHIEKLAALNLPKRYTIHYAKSKKEIDGHIETFLR